MLNLLVAVEHSLASSFALRTVCLIDLQSRVQPIYVIDPPARDISLGAGWAWKSWERETLQRAKSYIDDLVLAERNQCANIEEPVIATGDAVHALTSHFWKGSFDLLVAGAPFREWGPWALMRRLRHAAHKAGRELPLLLVRHLKSVHRVAALTDGSEAAQRALDLLARLYPLLSCDVFLLGLLPEWRSADDGETVDLAKAAADLKAKGIEAAGSKSLSLSSDDLRRHLGAADLVVGPFLGGDHHGPFQELVDNDVDAGLFCLTAD
jgi:hypothetical protein